MHIRCSYCRHSFTLSRDYLAEAVQKATEKGQKYHAVECANCRKLIKVPLKQMLRYVPRQGAGAEVEAESKEAQAE
jgi:hypothetical protein